MGAGAGGGTHLDPTFFISLVFFGFCLVFNARAVLAGRTKADGLNGGWRTVGHVSPLQQPPAPLPAGRTMFSSSSSSGRLRSVMMLDVRFRVGAASYWTVRPPTPLKRLVKLVDLSTLIRISIHARAEMVHLFYRLPPAGGGVVFITQNKTKKNHRNET